MTESYPAAARPVCPRDPFERGMCAWPASGVNECGHLLCVEAEAA